MSDGGSAQPVIPVTTGFVSAAPALRVIVVSDNRPTLAGLAMPVYVVADNRPTQGNVPVPVRLATGAQAGNVMAGPAIPVVVVSGQLIAPVNTVLPVISGGTAAVVATTDGTWTNTPSSFTYQWKRNGVNIGGATANTYTIVTADIGTTITVAVTASNAAGSTPATSAGYTPTYTQKVIALGPIAYWPQAEPSGVVALDASGNARNGAYTGVTLGNAGIGDGRTAAGFDGATAYNNVYSASLAGAFNGAEGTVVLWFKVNGAGVWTDATVRRHATFQVDGNNSVQMFKTATNNQLRGTYKAGGTSKDVLFSTVGELTWIHFALTWNKPADQMRVFYNGVQQGATLTALGVWAGALNSAQAVLGANATSAANDWFGLLAHAALFARALSAAEVLSTATL